MPVDLHNMALHGKIGAILSNVDELSLNICSLALHAFQRKTLITSDHMEQLIIAILDHFVDVGSSNRLKSIHYELLMELEPASKRKV
jgi:hypothetical protein